jgi:hypothetical protein
VIGFSGTPRFRLLDRLGSGSSGVVYRARDAETGVDVALKTLHTWDPGNFYGLKQEFRLIADVCHPNLVELYELHATDAGCYVTMELVDGVNFLEYLRHDPTDESRIADATLQLVHALAAVHAAGRLHRDVKPSNVLVTPTGRVVVLDFGLATTLRGGAGEGELAGTPAYMAQEQLWGLSLTPAADWYAVGVMLWEALSGALPFPTRVAEMVLAKREPPPSLRGAVPSVPDWIDALVRNLLEPDPGRRPDGKMLGDLLAVRGHAGATASTWFVVEREDRPFVNRTAELAALDSAFARSAAGPMTVVVRGSSGMGKSRLVQHFIDRVASSAGAMVLSGRCHPQETVTYKGFDDLIDQLSRELVQLGPEQLRELIPEHAAALRLAFPVLARVPELVEAREIDTGAEPQKLRRRGFVALRTLLARLSAERPLVLWIDDAQWAGEDSAELLRELLRPRDALKALTVLSVRDEQGEWGPMRAACRDSGGAPVEVVLELLDAAATRALVQAVVPPGDIDVDAVAADSQGSPFLITQLAGLEGGRPPVRLDEVLDERVAHLVPEALAVLEVTCVAGRPIDRRHVLEAAGCGEKGRPLIAALRRGRFVRLVGVDSLALETYHDRVREAVIARLSPAVLADRHRTLARTLEASGAGEPDRLAEHLFAAGETEHASVWAARAGDRASSALAFAQAAVQYRRAREWWAGPAERQRELQIKEAEALVNAGRCVDAARLYVLASAGAVAESSLDLRRRAAEQFLAGGHVDDGLGILVPLLDELRVGYPSTQRRAMLRTLGSLLRLRARGTHFRRRSLDEIPRRTVLRVDVCYSAAKSFAIVDPARGIYFSVVGALLALAAGEPVRIGKTLALAGGALRSLGGRLGTWGQRLIEEVADLAERENDPYLTGMSATSMGPVHLVAGEWAEALECAERGVRLLTDRCRGVSFESAIGRMAALRAQEELGLMNEMQASAEEMLAAAQQAGDRYAEVTALLNLALPVLASGDVVGARTRAAQALDRWTRTGFHIQHFYARRIEAYCDLYEGCPDGARARILEIWPALRASFLLRVPVSRVDAYLLRARSTVALASRNARYMSAAAGDVAMLARESRSDAMAHSLILWAALCALRGEQSIAVEMIERATDAYRRAGMQLHALCTVRQLAALTGAVDTMADTDERIRASGVMNPSRWADVYAPGFRTG